MIEPKTLEDFENAFPDEESARKYIFGLRWGKFAVCPYCGNEKCYFTNNGMRNKCAKCKLIFSVKVRTLLEDSNLKYTQILKLFFLYTKSNGKISNLDLANQSKISHKTEFFIREKLDFIWEYIIKNKKNNHEPLIEAIKQSFLLYYNYISIKEQRFNRFPFHIAPNEIYNMADPEQYNKLIRYIRYFVTVYARDWIFIDFASPEDILTEVFLDFKDNDIKDYNTQVVLKGIWRVTAKMWVKYLNEHPKYNEYLKRKARKNKKVKIDNLKDSYIVDKLMESQLSKGKTRQEIKSDRGLIEMKRQQIINRRKKIGAGLIDFYSHFD
jgi:transposase-like zinc ribbon protein